jgi:hypothetical protein
MPEAHVTNWPDAEERIRPILDKFDELQGGVIEMGAKKVRAVRRSAAREWLETFGTNLPLLEACYKKLKAGGMTVSTERSLINTGLDLRMKVNGSPRACPECCGVWYDGAFLHHPGCQWGIDDE